MAFEGTPAEQFAAAQEAVKSLTKDPGNDTKLAIYALFKQATEGDVSGKRPGRLDMVKRAKYDAWDKLKGMSTADAQQKYADTIAGLV